MEKGENIRSPPPPRVPESDALTSFLGSFQGVLTPARLNGRVPSTSRVEAGRRRASTAKRAVALTAASGFVVVLGVARHAHPGTAATHTAQSSSTGVSSDAQGGFSLGGGSITSPSVESSSSGSAAGTSGFSTAAPQVRSSSS